MDGRQGARVVYACGDLRVLLLKRKHAYSVEIAGGEYGPFNWPDACDWYRRHASKPLRSYTFRPYRAGMGPHFILTTWDARRQTELGKHVIAYRLTMHGNGAPVVLFHADDFACSPMVAIDSVGAAEAIMDFLTLRPGDTDAEYFANYTDAQKDYCARYAEALGAEVDARWKDADGNLKERYR